MFLPDPRKKTKPTAEWTKKKTYYKLNKKHTQKGQKCQKYPIESFWYFSSSSIPAPDIRSPASSSYYSRPQARTFQFLPP